MSFNEGGGVIVQTSDVLGHHSYQISRSDSEG